jgi:hypothetical protein
MRHEGCEENLRSHEAEPSQHIGPSGNDPQFLRELGSYFALYLHVNSPEFLSARRVSQVDAATQKKQAGDQSWRDPENDEAHLPNWG